MPHKENALRNLVTVYEWISDSTLINPADVESMLV